MPSTVTVPCFKCSGQGRIRGFGHVADGRCFQCGGTGRLADTGRRVSAQACTAPDRIDATNAQWAAIERIMRRDGAFNVGQITRACGFAADSLTTDQADAVIARFSRERWVRPAPVAA